jgi:predicted patatin/cPLA2 family phospholipase
MVVPAPLATRLLRKRDLLLRDDPAHEEIKTALVIGGGGMRGVYGGGAVIALHQLGLTNAFDYLVGVSAGAADCAYFLSGQPEVGTSLYYEEFASKRFVNLLRPSKIMDLEYLADQVRNGKPLDVARIRSSRSKLFIGVTNVENGACELIDVRSDSVDIVSAIAASCALPGISRSTHCIGENSYVDGVASCGLPVGFAIDTLGCTDILVIVNAPFTEEKSPPSFAEKLLVSILARDLPSSIRHAFATRNLAYNDAAARIRASENPNSGVTVGVIAPNRIAVGNITTDASTLRRTAEQGAQDAMRFFGIDKSVDISPVSD